MSFLSLFSGSFTGAGVERLVFAVFESGTLHLFENLICGSVVRLQLSENGVKQSLCHVVGVSVGSLDFYINLIGIYAEREV